MCTPTLKPMAARDLETRGGHPNLPNLENSEAGSGTWGTPAPSRELLGPPNTLARELSHEAHRAPSGPVWGLQVTYLNAWTPFLLCFIIIYIFIMK